MPAANVIDLYRYEDAIETAVKTLLQANGIAAYKQQDTAETVTPRAEIQFAPGAAEEHYHLFLNGDQRPDVFTGSLQVAVVTNRETNGLDHSTVRATVRHLIYGFLETLNPLLAYHAIYRVLESGSSPTIQPEENHDRTEINFSVEFNIRTDAWLTA